MTIRFRLTVAAVTVIVVANSLLSLVGVKYFGDVWLDEVQNRVRRNLSSARASYNNYVDGIAIFLEAVSLDQSVAAALESRDTAAIGEILRNIYRAGGMDFVSMLTADGTVLYRARNPSQVGDSLRANPLIANILGRKQPALAGSTRRKVSATGTIVLSAEELGREGEDLAQRARFELLPTLAAKPTRDEFRSEGMVVAAATPVLSDRGKLVGILYAGNLLNRRYEIVDSIKEEVFAHHVHEGKAVGTVTIFQGDLRISTNVRTNAGFRAVGTRLSEAVYDDVLVKGEIWAAPAFVVNDWYITAYEPIRNPEGAIIGALYVGLLRAPFVQRQRVIVAAFLVMVTATAAAILILLFFVTRQLLRPIGSITGMVRQIVAGDLSARIGIRPSGEMGLLCQAIDSMADAVAEREERLKLTARQQIGQSEKLASIGRLAAGVAHEINNPLTGVLTFAHLLHDKENMDEQDRQDLDLIIHETTRAAGIVRGLLDFARERPSMKEPLDINEIIRRTIRLLGNQKAFQQIMIVENLQDDLPLLDGDVNQIQQVMLNLCLNACEAMPDGGTLLVDTSVVNEKVIVRVTDTGCGIKKEHFDQVFEPFFSTKPVGKGTGLGLSVTYGIVQQHGGEIDFESEEKKGTTFTIAFPSLDDSSSADQKEKQKATNE